MAATLGKRVSVAQVAVKVVSSVAAAAAAKNAGAGSVFLGDSTVTDATGFELVAGATIELSPVRDDVWAISTAGTNVVHVLEV